MSRLSTLSGHVDANEVSTDLADMVGYGFHHVIGGADHLLFLLTLLLVAGRSVRSTIGVVTAFTIGHSLTLIASSLGWVSVPQGPVEVLIALSIAAAAVHAMRPLVRNGERWIAGGFGLVHGLAFAGILTDLGLEGSTSVVALLAFNVGVELAQLTAVLLVLPSLYVMSQTRFYPAVRITGATFAFVAALGWGADRLGVFTNPLAGVEAAAIANPYPIVIGLAVLAGVLSLLTETPEVPTRTLQAAQSAPSARRP